MSNTLSKSHLQIEDAALDWKDAVESHRGDKLAPLYAAQAIFFGALSSRIYSNKDGIREYYDQLSKLEGLRVNFLETNIQFSGNTAVNSGIYRYDYLEDEVQRSIVARYTFVLRQEVDEWVIIAHHSSVLPQNILG